MLAKVSFQWLAEVSFTIWLLISSRITLLILPTLDFYGFIKWQGILSWKLSLWPFIVIHTSVSCIFSILSEICSLFLIFLEFLFILHSFVRFHLFLVMFSFNSFLYSFCSISNIFLGLSGKTKILFLFLMLYVICRFCLNSA